MMTTKITLQERVLRSCLALLMAAGLAFGNSFQAMAAVSGLEISGTNNTIAVTHSGSDLFNFPGMMPGETQIRAVNLRNTHPKTASVHLRVEVPRTLYSSDADWQKAKLLGGRILLVVERQMAGGAKEVVYRGPLTGSVNGAYNKQAIDLPWFDLGNMAAGSTGVLTLSIQADGPSIGNYFINSQFHTNWIFEVRAEEDSPNPTPTPTPTPTPNPPPDPDPDPYVPGGGTGGGGTTTTPSGVADYSVPTPGESVADYTIDENEVPTGEAPYVIGDNQVPLSELPKSGGSLQLAADLLQAALREFGKDPAGTQH